MKMFLAIVRPILAFICLTCASWIVTLGFLANSH